MADFNLEPGRGYILRTHAKNTSTKAGQPWPAMLRVIATLQLGVNNLVSSDQDYDFAADEERTFDYPFAVPQGTAGQTGTIAVILKAPDGSGLGSALATVGVAAPVSLPFSFSNLVAAMTTDQYGTSYFVMSLDATVRNLNAQAVTRTLRCKAGLGGSDPSLAASYLWTRKWEDGSEAKVVTLQPGQSIGLSSPYYIGVVENSPLGMYHSGTPRKYWLAIMDDLGNIAYTSVGQYF